MIQPSLSELLCIWRSVAEANDGITSKIDHGKNSKSMQGTRVWSLGQYRDDVGEPGSVRSILNP